MLKSYDVAINKSPPMVRSMKTGVHRHYQDHGISQRMILRSLFLLCTLIVTACSREITESPYAEGTRLIQPLNQSWQFTLAEPQPGAPLTDHEWQDITLPHTWNARDGQNGGDDYHRGTGVYRRQIQLDTNFEGKRLYLHFDGAAISAAVYVNGKRAGEHKGSYGAFRFDVTNLIVAGENSLEVHVSNVRDDNIAPLSADFTFFGGLYRQARLIATNSLHIDTMDHASSGVFWTQKKVDKHRAELNLRTTIVNESAADEAVTVVARLTDDQDRVVTEERRDIILAEGEHKKIELALSVDSPRLWHGREDPYLYKAQVTVRRGDQILDDVSEPLGLRSFSVDSQKGFMLNGEHYPLRGINRMPDFLNKGTAISREDHERDIQLMLEVGATSVRFGHQQRDAWVYRRADEVGLVVWAEIPLINRINDTEIFAENLKRQARELIRQNYNRGSIAIWGLYNEVTLKPGPDPRPLVQQLHTLVKTEDPIRLTSAAVAAEGALDDPLVTTPDLISFNRYDGWYYGNLDSFSEFLDHMRRENDELLIGIGEYGAGASPQIQSDQPVMQDHSEQYQALYHEAYWEALQARPWLWGHYIWVLADFAVDNRNEGDTPGRNDKGLVSYDRKVKKDAFYWYKASWSQEPVLHITGSRHTPRIDSVIDVKIYTNLSTVELKVNGESLGQKNREELTRMVWENVPLKMGENRIEAKATKNGTTVSDAIQVTRINSNDTGLHSRFLGVDNERAKIYNAPFGAQLSDVKVLLDTPTESSLAIAGNPEDATLMPGMSIRVTAQDGVTSQNYELMRAPLSVGKPVWASSEIAGEMSIGPFDMPEMSAARANDGIINSDPDQGMLDANIWMTTGGKNHWWKVDLGAEYHLESIEITWPQHAGMIVQGAMTYSVEIAKDFQQTFDVFSETYQEVVDQRNNQRPNTTTDILQTSGRYVRLKLLDSGIFSETPLVGKYPIYGAEEITILGGLLYSGTLAVDYRERSITVPEGTTAAEVLGSLSAVKGGSLELIDIKNQPLQGKMRVSPGALVIARDESGKLIESYELVQKHKYR